MKHSDKSKHTICVAKIKRSTIKPYDFSWTNFYENNFEFQNKYPLLSLKLDEAELIICSTIIDIDNFSVLTTKQLITKENGMLSTCDMQEASDKFYGDFKGQSKNDFTFGEVRLLNGSNFKYFIEVGNASMIMIHGVRTLLRTNDMTAAPSPLYAAVWSPDQWLK